MQPVIGFDTETHLIEPGCLAPRLVCYQWQETGKRPMILHRERAYGTVRQHLEGSAVMVGHNVAYDMGVICAKWPDMMPLVFAKYNRDQVTDTKIREQLIMIARGQFRSYIGQDGEAHPVNYALSDCIARHFGRQLKKEGFRLFYRIFEDAPDPSSWEEVARLAIDGWRFNGYSDWILESPDAMKQLPGLLAADPSEALSYALADATTTLDLYEDQERVGAGKLADQFRQARAAFALHLSSCWGIYTDPEATEKLAAKLEARFEELTADLQSEGIIREDGTADTKAARVAMEEACLEEGFPLLMTSGGKSGNRQVSLSAEACGRFEETSVIGAYAEFQTTRKTLSNDIKMLRKGNEIPIQPRYDLADTGRTRCSKPNIQAINRGEGIRDCFHPREGTVFIQADFEGLELHTLAQWCVSKLGKSELAKALNAKIDVHTDMAATFLGISYEEAMARKKADDEEIKEHRRRAKAVNFGFPGGLGVKKLVRYAKMNYGATLSEADAKLAKDAWMRKLPEMIDFFRLSALATANDTAADEESLFTGRWRGGLRYSALCNGRFQGLGADAAKAAMWVVTEACYTHTQSPLFGCRVVAFIHDEVIAECPDEPYKIDAAARELGRLMCEAANVYLPDVPVRTEPQAMRRWSKKAKPVFLDGLLVPWDDTEENDHGEPLHEV